jgi:hypothetical protein
VTRTLLPPPRLSLPPVATLPPLRLPDVDAIMDLHCRMVVQHEQRHAETMRPGGGR